MTGGGGDVRCGIRQGSLWGRVLWSHLATPATRPVPLPILPSLSLVFTCLSASQGGLINYCQRSPCGEEPSPNASSANEPGSLWRWLWEGTAICRQITGFSVVKLKLHWFEIAFEVTDSWLSQTAPHAPGSLRSAEGGKQPSVVVQWATHTTPWRDPGRDRWGPLGNDRK